MKVDILQVAREHLPGIAALETVCFSEPWSENALGLFLGDEAVAFAAVHGETVLGYIGMLLAPGEGQILNLAVLPEARRQGLARALVARLIEEAERKNLAALSLEVRVSNAPAIRLYQSFGFQIAGTRKHFYRRPTEDGLVMIKPLAPKSDV